VNGKEIQLECGNYRLPLAVAGVQVDCAVTKGYLETTRSAVWGLEKDARLRLWPEGSPWMAAKPAAAQDARGCVCPVLAFQNERMHGAPFPPRFPFPVRRNSGH
jgi:hypothetical protein